MFVSDVFHVEFSKVQHFITVLVDYFACDGAAADRMLSREEAEACTRKYEAARLSFLSERERRALSDGPAARDAGLRTGHRRFRDWVATSPDHVSRLRKLARDVAREGAS